MKEKKDIIIFGGQSNMQGQCECLSEAEEVKKALEYKFLTDSFVPLKNPVGENIPYDPDFIEDHPDDPMYEAKHFLANYAIGMACYAHTNLIPEFCRAYIGKTGKKVIAVPVAKGSTTVAMWLPGTDNYNALLKKVQGALKKTQMEFEPDKIFFVWLQGESDACEGNSKEYYKEKIKVLCEGLKKDCGIEKFGVIRVGKFAGDERDDEIISAQDEICREDDDFIMLTDIATKLNDMPEYMNPNVAGHYSAKGLETLGRLAGEKLAEERIN